MRRAVAGLITHQPYPHQAYRIAEGSAASQINLFATKSNLDQMADAKEVRFGDECALRRCR